MGVDKDGVAFYAAGAFDAFGVDGALAKTKVYRSSDNGVSWQDTAFGAGGQDIPPTTLDPYVYVDDQTGRVYSIDLAGAGSFLMFSDDKGETLGQQSAMSCARRQRPPDVLLPAPPSSRQPRLITTTGLLVPERHLLLPSTRSRCLDRCFA